MDLSWPRRVTNGYSRLLPCDDHHQGRSTHCVQALPTEGLRVPLSPADVTFLMSKGLMRYLMRGEAAGRTPITWSTWMRS